MPALFSDDDLKTMFGIFDVTGCGKVSGQQLKQGGVWPGSNSALRCGGVGGARDPPARCANMQWLLCVWVRSVGQHWHPRLHGRRWGQRAGGPPNVSQHLVRGLAAPCGCLNCVGGRTVTDFVLVVVFVVRPLLLLRFFACYAVGGLQQGGANNARLAIQRRLMQPLSEAASHCTTTLSPMYTRSVSQLRWRTRRGP